MKADTYSLTTVFGKDVRYVVPLYQRRYVWVKDKHWEPLWEDLQIVIRKLVQAERLAEAAPDAPPTLVPPHFLGAVVLDQQLVKTGSLESRLIIDGQQRLATLQLLISAAITVAETNRCDREARLLRKLTENDRDLIVSPEDSFKVWPTNVDRDAFQAAMTGEGTPAKEGIRGARAFFVDEISEWARNGGDLDGITIERRIASLTRVVRELFKMVVIDLEEGDNAQIIFETLNARGTPLLAVDLVKNLLFQRLGPGVDLEDLYRRYWSKFDEDEWRKDVRQGRLNRPKAELFLMHWLAMKRTEEVGAHYLFPVFRQLLEEQPQANVSAVMNEFSVDADIFQSFESMAEGSPEKRFFARLRIMDVGTVLPLLLFLFRQDPLELSESKRRRALEILESWLVRRMICRLTPKNYNRYFVELVKAVEKDPSQADDILYEELRRGEAATTVWPTDAALEEVLLGSGLYGNVTQPRIVMVLGAVETAMRSEKSEEVPLPSGLTIEHVLPRDWADNWPIYPPGDAAMTLERQKRVHRIGNLTLVTSKLNPSISNGSWDVKREGLNQHSVLLLNRRLVDEHADWNHEAIDTRSREIYQIICWLWPGPDSEYWQVRY
jgi:hypothetical protein